MKKKKIIIRPIVQVLWGKNNHPDKNMGQRNKNRQLNNCQNSKARVLVLITLMSYVFHSVTLM